MGEIGNVMIQENSRAVNTHLNVSVKIELLFQSLFSLKKKRISLTFCKQLGSPYKERDVNTIIYY